MPECDFWAFMVHVAGVGARGPWWSQSINHCPNSALNLLPSQQRHGRCISHTHQKFEFWHKRYNLGLTASFGFCWNSVLKWSVSRPRYLNRITTVRTVNWAAFGRTLMSLHQWTTLNEKSILVKKIQPLFGPLKNIFLFLCTPALDEKLTPCTGL